MQTAGKFKDEIINNVPLRIMLISREYPPETAWGGIGKYTYLLARGLVGRGHTVHVVCESLTEEDEYLDEGVFVHRIVNRNIFDNSAEWPEVHDRLSFARSVFEKVEEVHQKYNFHISEGPNFGAEALLISLHSLIPLVTRLHTSYIQLVNHI